MDARVTGGIELNWPEPGVCDSVPYGVFNERAVYDREMERIFQGPTWNFLGLDAEVPNPGDFKSTFIGDIPVVMVRDDDGEIYAWENRCSHRGALVIRENCGSSDGSHTCVYHQWSFNNKGDLIGVPFRRGLGGNGGMPEDFDMAANPVRKIRVENYNGAVFGTFDRDMEDVDAYLGGDSDVNFHVKRIFNRPVKVLGHARQYIPSNWKFYAENTKDPYHASLLHLFHMTFGLYRSSQTGGVRISNGWNTVLFSQSGTDSEASLKETNDAHLRTYQAGEYSLADMSLLAGRAGEWGDNTTLVILSIMPTLVIQQIQNTLAVRQIVPKNENEFELVWTYFGYEDDDQELDAIRLKQINLIGPAGLISMEDGESSVICQQAITRSRDARNVIQMGGKTAEDQDHLVTETTIRGFWQKYRELMAY
ncbi:MAG TPA: Rieske (2Fe-2S) protein [Gammaproteobacteria bacterium]|nr:Rieske (2Fe-2S) protein [Gammaproteobacteria bacterium]